MYEASFLRILLRRSDSSHCSEIRALKEERDEFWWDREAFAEHVHVLICPLPPGIMF